MACFIHADIDAFYASVEQLDHPGYRGKPVIVGGLPSDKRSVVSTASYEARSFGVHSAMPIFQAYKLCPGGIFLRGNMGRYKEKSQEVLAVFSDFSPDVKAISIDEAFIDITGTERLFGPPETLAKNLKERVLRKTGLVVSLGLASNKYIAKIASGMSKPDGLYIIPPGGEEGFMRSLRVNKIWGAGRKSQELFKKYGLKTGEDIYALPKEKLTLIFGKAFGLFLYRAVRGEAAAAFDDDRGSHSISSERTFPHDLYDEFTIETVLFDICQDLMFRLYTNNLQGRTIFIKIRYDDFHTESARETYPYPVVSMNELFEFLRLLFQKKYKPGRRVRLLGAGLSNLEPENHSRQNELFEMINEKERKLEKHILEINTKYPHAALKRGRSWLIDK
ncbi:MAG: DNA polymerase IV [Treponema sp.]|jgi:DNA polymerase-4|nr:DNA polymerase IV [Treponema sp.]